MFFWTFFPCLKKDDTPNSDLLPNKGNRGNQGNLGIQDNRGNWGQSGHSWQSSNQALRVTQGIRAIRENRAFRTIRTIRAIKAIRAITNYHEYKLLIILDLPSLSDDLISSSRGVVYIVTCLGNRVTMCPCTHRVIW